MDNMASLILLHQLVSTLSTLGSRIIWAIWATVEVTVAALARMKQCLHLLGQCKILEFVRLNPKVTFYSKHRTADDLQSGIQSGTPQHRERFDMPTSNRPAPRSSIPQPTHGFLAGSMNPPSASRQHAGLNGNRLAAMSSGSYGLSAAAKIGRASGVAASPFHAKFGNGLFFIYLFILYIRNLC
jgi:hypothetical protein